MNNDNKAAPEGILWVLSLREAPILEESWCGFVEGKERQWQSLGNAGKSSRKKKQINDRAASRNVICLKAYFCGIGRVGLLSFVEG